MAVQKAKPKAKAKALRPTASAASVARRSPAAAAAPKAPPLQLSLQFADTSARAALPRHRVQRWLRAALQAPAQITVRIVGADEGLALNRDFRGQDHATNVLTFDYEREPVVVADLVLCAPVVAAEALAQRLPLQDHYAHLLVHGALHAQGMDHIEEADALEMEACESQLMLALGFADPYRQARKAAPAKAATAKPAPRRAAPTKAAKRS